MNKKNLFIASIWLLLLCGSSQAQTFNPVTYSPAVKQIEVDGNKCGLQLYVAPEGNDNASGKSPATAFKTLEKARDEVRAIIKNGKLPKGGIAINLLKGNYPLTRSFELNNFDSGTENAPIIYRPYNNDDVHILGGVNIKNSSFSTAPAKLTGD